MTDTSILIIYTGGTIGMVKNEETNSLIPFDFDQVYEHIPELKKLHYHIQSVSFNPLIDSSDIQPHHWIQP